MHELTHSIEKSDFYKDYRDFVINELYGNNTMMLMEAVNNKIRQYAKDNIGLDPDRAEKELVAEFTRNKLFNDEAAIDRLVSEKPNLAVRIYQAIVQAIEKANAYFKGEDAYKQYKALETGRKLFEKALDNRGVDRSTKVKSGAQYSIETLPDGRKYVQADRQVIYSDNPETWGHDLERYINEKIRNGKDLLIPTDDGDVLTINGKTAWKMGFRNDIKQDGNTRKMTDDEFATKLTAASHIDELAQISKRGNENVPDRDNKHKGEFAKDGWNYRTAFFRDFDGSYYRLAIDVALDAEGKTVYNIADIRKRSFPSGSGSSSKGGALNDGKASSNPILAQSDGKSNTFYQTSENNSETEKTAMQIALEKAGITNQYMQDGGKDVNDVDFDIEKGYNGSRQYSLDDGNWHTDLSREQFGMLERWVRQDAKTSTKIITDTANWYMGRLDGDSIFAIYSTEDSKGPTILYEVKGEQAEIERDVLMDIMEDEENGKSINGKSSFTKRVSEGSWLQNVNGSQNNLGNLGSGRHNQNAGVLQRQPRRNGRRAFWNVIEDLFKKQDRVNQTTSDVNDAQFSLDKDGKDGLFDSTKSDISYSFKEDNKTDTSRSQFYDNTIKRATAIPQAVKDSLNPESFDFIPETSKEWQDKAIKNVNADLEGVKERLENSASISGGIEGHEAAAVTQKLIDKYKKSGIQIGRTVKQEKNLSESADNGINLSENN